MDMEELEKKVDCKNKFVISTGFHWYGHNKQDLFENGQEEILDELYQWFFHHPATNAMNNFIPFNL